MESESYTVVLQYAPENLEIHEKVIACLSRLAPASTSRIQQLRSNGRLIVKRNTDISTAKRIRSILLKTGAVCHINRVPQRMAQPPTNNAQAVGYPLSPPMADKPASAVECPNCGLQQPVALECRGCGIIFAKAAMRVKPRQTEAHPDENKDHTSALMQTLKGLQAYVQPFQNLLKMIQHPLSKEKLTSWARIVTDRCIRCGLVFSIALILETGFLVLSKMLWYLYTATVVGQHFVNRMPEEALPIQNILNSDLPLLSLETTAVVLMIGLLVGSAAQTSHLYRYLYEPFGFIARLILWYIPVVGLSAWVISQRPPYPEYAYVCVLVALPVLVMLSSCLILARAALPELGDLKKIVDIIAVNRENTWRFILQNIWTWFETTKKRIG